MKSSKFFTLGWMIGLSILLLLSSCVSKEKMVYLQSPEGENPNLKLTQQNYELSIEPDDQLAIAISSKYEELIVPFNTKTLVGSINGKNGTSSTTSTPKLNYFLVDSKGYIDFPVLGKQYVKGMTCAQLRNSLEKQLKDGNHIKDAQVDVKFMSFKVIVMGEVGKPGVQSVDGERYTILEAISTAGDLLPSALRQNIKVVREENGMRNTYYVDLTSNEGVMNSPVYYLKQNDVVYVEPNKSIGLRGSSALPIVTTTAGIISTILSLATVIISLSK